MIIILCRQDGNYYVRYLNYSCIPPVKTNTIRRVLGETGEYGALFKLHNFYTTLLFYLKKYYAVPS